MKKFWIFVFALFVLFGTAHAARAGNLVVGVNTVGIERMTDQQQDAFVEQLQQNGVKVVRLGIDEKYNHTRLSTRYRRRGRRVPLAWQ